jgi:hypothetical protein
MKKIAICIVAALYAVALAGCLEIDLSRTNGNQKADETEQTDTTAE